MDNPLSVDDRLAQVLEAQRKADEAYASIEQDFPEAWERLQKIEYIRNQAEELKQKIRDELIEQKDYDLHQVNGYNVSVSKTVKLVAVDPEAIPMEFKKPTEEKWDVDVKHAQEYFKVTKQLPAGFEDKSSYKLNWREVKNA